MKSGIRSQVKAASTRHEVKRLLRQATRAGLDDEQMDRIHRTADTTLRSLGFENDPKLSRETRRAIRQARYVPPPPVLSAEGSYPCSLHQEG